MRACETLLKKLDENGHTISTAESCTGGMVSQEITSFPGSSRYYVGGVVAYSNEVKVKFLGVDPDTLERCGAVSEDVAIQMAKGACKSFGSSTSIGITGIAGPGGATPDKPVGLVYIAVSVDPRVVVSRNIFEGDRDSVRKAAKETAFNMLIELLEGRL